MREVKLPSGAILKIGLAPFADSKALFQAVLKEAKGVGISKDSELTSVFKDLFCLAYSSPEIEAALWKCMARSTYNSGSGDLKIEPASFEPESARADYLSVCMEVAKDNIAPFVKNLYAEYQQALAMTGNTPA